MKAALLHGPRDLSVEEVPEPKRPVGGDVLVQIRRVALCGSDVHYYRHGQHSAPVAFPLVLGHEASGIVLEAGEDAVGFQPGDRVALEPGVPCGQCLYCARDRYQFCEKMNFMASRGYPGALQEKVVWPASRLWKLPAGMSLDEGALLEPLSVAYSAVEKLDFGGLSKALILGAGSIGLLMFKLIRQLHPQVEIVMVDKYGEKFDLALRQGVETGLSIVLGDGPQALPAVDAVLDTTGNPQAVEAAFRSLRRGGQLVLVGLSREPLGICVMDLVYKGVALHGSYRYAHTYPKLLQLSSAHGFDTERLITHRFDLEHAQEAFETASSANCLKAVIEL